MPNARIMYNIELLTLVLINFISSVRLQFALNLDLETTAAYQSEKSSRAELMSLYHHPCDNSLYYRMPLPHNHCRRKTAASSLHTANTIPRMRTALPSWPWRTTRSYAIVWGPHTLEASKRCSQGWRKTENHQQSTAEMLNIKWRRPPCL